LATARSAFELPCVYLGTIKFDSSGNVLRFVKNKWRYVMGVVETISGNTAQWPGFVASPHDLSNGIPPSARVMNATLYAGSESTEAYSAYANIYDSSGTSILAAAYTNGAWCTYRRIQAPINWTMDMTEKIQVCFAMYINNYNYDAPAKLAQINISGFEE